MSKPTSLKRNAFALLAMQAVTYLVPLITLPYLTRILGVAQYGALNLAISLVQYAMLVTNFGFNLSTTQYIARHREQPLLISRVFWETLSAKFLLMLLSSVVLIIVTLSIERFYEIRWVVFILLLQVLSVALDPLWFFQGIEKLERVSLIGSVVKLLTIPLLLVFVRSPEDVKMAAFIQAAILLLASMINLALVYREKVIVCIKYSQLKIIQAIQASLPLFIGAAAISLYNTSTPVILGLVNSYEEVGVYSASFRVQGAVIGMFFVLGQVFYPRVNYLFGQDPVLGYTFVRKLIIGLFPVALVGAVAFYCMMPWLAPLILGGEFDQTATTLKIMAPMIFLTPFAVVLANYLLLPLGYKRVFYIVPLIIGLMHVIYSTILSKYFGAVGASWSIVMTELLIFCTLVLFSLKNTEIKYYLVKNK